VSVCAIAAGCRDTPLPPVPVLRLALAHPDELLIGGGASHLFGLALAPDGRRLVVAASRDHAVQLWVRDLASDGVEPLAGTTNGQLPFWSPDGSRIGFFADGKLRALSLADGTVQDLADAPSPAGAAWLEDGEIVFAPRHDAALMRRHVDGRVEPFTALEASESSHRWPHAVSSTHIVFFVRAAEPARQGVWIAPRDRPATRRRLVNSDAEGTAVDTALVYASGDALVAQRIDLETLALTGRSQLLGSPVGRNGDHQLFATSGAEVLIYGLPPSVLRELRWVDRTGARVATVGEPMNATDVRLAPQGDRIAVARVDPQLRTFDIWIYDGSQPVPRRISPAIDADDSPVWSSDSSQLGWVSGRRSIIVRDSRAERSERVLNKFDNPIRVTDWASGGGWMVIAESRAATGSDLRLVPANTSANAEKGIARDARGYAQAPFNETSGVISPDSRWLAYASDESGAMEVYVDAFPTPGRRARLSVGGGAEPRWARDGRAVFFRRGAELHVVTLGVGNGAIAATSSERLFTADAEIRSYDVTPDGQRFLLNLPASRAPVSPLTVLVHMRSLLPSAP
jgi:Tol biopolymer transport system component